MNLPVVLIVVGIIVALLVHQTLGLAMILGGIVLYFWPRLKKSF